MSDAVTEPTGIRPSGDYLRAGDAWLPLAAAPAEHTVVAHDERGDGIRTLPRSSDAAHVRLVAEAQVDGVWFTVTSVWSRDGERVYGTTPATDTDRVVTLVVRDGADAEAASRVDGAQRQGPWSNWPGDVFFDRCPLARIAAYRETVTRVDPAG